MDVRIVGSSPPEPLLGGVALLAGLQRGRDVPEPRPVTGAPMTFEAALEVTVTAAGIDYRGPWVHGRRRERFLYLCWGRDDGAGFTTLRRAKLMLGVLDPAEMVAARAGSVLEGRLALTDTSGGPVCAAVRPPSIRWSLGGG